MKALILMISLVASVGPAYADLSRDAIRESPKPERAASAKLPREWQTDHSLFDETKEAPAGQKSSPTARRSSSNLTKQK